MAETINMPKLGFDMAEGTLIRWLKKLDDPVKKGELLAEIETDKATVEVESPAGGVVRKLLVDEGAVVPVGMPIAIVGTADEKIEMPLAQLKESHRVEGIGHPDLIPALPVAPVVPPSGSVALPEKTSGIARLPGSPSMAGHASPLAKRMARESQVDLSNVKGSGPEGRIVRRDIEAVLAGEGKIDAFGSQPTLPVRLSSVSSVPRPDQMVSLSRLRQAIARRMGESMSTIPHFHVTHDFKMEALLDLRRQYNAIVNEEQKLSINDFVIKAVALTLSQFPNLNATLKGTSVLHHGSINVGVAVSVEGGLLTVVCRDADRKPLQQISAEVRSMAAGARAGKLRPQEIEGSTFSISNLGMYDVENFLAIINPPEVAILAVASAREIPVVEAGTLKPGWRMKASLAVDHRVSDGAEGARFMQALAVYLEEPLRLMI
jgi:pyruvate dehydrogenase E2 component (dihydrolipoamide acetyltransferase)